MGVRYVLRGMMLDVGCSFSSNCWVVCVKTSTSGREREFFFLRTWGSRLVESPAAQTKLKLEEIFCMRETDRCVWYYGSSAFEASNSL